MADTSGVDSTSLELLLEFDGDTTDSSSNGRDQTPYAGAITYASDGAVGQAAKLKYGDSNFIDTGVNALGSADLFCDSGSSDFTLACFVRFSDNSALGTGTICSRFDDVSGSASGRNFWLAFPSINKLLVQLRGQTTQFDVDSHDGDWHQVVVTWDGTDATVYFDGTSLGTVPVGNIAENTTNILIGAITSSNRLGTLLGYISKLTGQLDDFRIYSRALSAFEISLLWAYGGGDTGDGFSVAPGPFDNMELWLRYETDTTDSSINERDQTVSNGPLTFNAGVEGAKAARYTSASSQYIDTGVAALGSATLLCGASDAWTVAVWIKKDSGASGIGTILSKRTSGGLNFSMRPNTSGGGELEVYLKGNLNQYALATIDDNDWHHVAVTWDGSAAVVYYDGSAQAAPAVGAVADTTPEHILIGARDSIGGGVPANYTLLYDGHMDDLRVYSRKLTAGEISGIYSGTTLSTFSATLTVTGFSGDVTSFQVVFGDTPTAFVAGDVTVTNGTASNVAGSGTTYTFDVTTTATGAVTVQVAAGAVVNSDGAANADSNLVSYGAVLAAESGGLARFDRTGSMAHTASVIIGPVRISPNACEKSILSKMRAVFGSGTSCTANVNVSAGVDAEDAVTRAINDAPQYSVTVSTLDANHGISYPRIGGHALAIELDITSGSLILEQIDVYLEPKGSNTGARYSP